ncbi:MAG: glycoside hydrolase domain-containing protein [Chitinophagaceae bacterium]
MLNPFSNYKPASIFFLVLIGSYCSNAQAVRFVSGNNSWNPDSLGNHRFIVTVSPTEFLKNKNVVRVIVPWRRRDMQPEEKRIIIEGAKTGRKVLNVQIKKAEREYGEIFFEPVSGAGKYYVYYMPYKNEGRSNYPRGVYLKPETTASPGWLTLLGQLKKFPAAMVTVYQSIDEFNSFYPMEFIATAAETKKLEQQNTGSSFLVFPEDRLHSIRMQNDLPQRWIQKGAGKVFSDNVKRGENFTFQLGIYALQNLEDVKISFGNLKNSKGGVIAAKNFSCFNTDGTSYTGTILHPVVNSEKGKIQAMWCAMDVPENSTPGLYTGKIIISAKNVSSVKEITLHITVNNEVAKDGGIAEPWKQTRLKWLNSTLAQDNTVIAPYTALKIEDTAISLLGRKISLNKDGFPSQIQTYFTPEMTSVSDKSNDLLMEPLHFHFYDADGKQSLQWKNTGLQFTQQEPGKVKWEASNLSASLQMDVSASLEFDGFLAYTVKLTALQDVSFKDIVFHLPVQREFSKYIMGLGLKGGVLPDSVSWKWDVASKNQDGAWLGNVNAGLQFSLRDEHYVRPLNTNFYLQKPLLLPSSWGNVNKGGIDIIKREKSVLVNAYSGARMLKKDSVLYYNFNLLITPFHTINTDFQWQARFYHKYNDLDSIKATGATIVNIHHATPINPWINYPFIEWKKMKRYIDGAHSKGLKVKIYNTIRELSDKAYETFAMRSLGHEIYSPGKGGGFSWLQEHVGENYIAAWFVPDLKDAALINSGMNRWHNYYVEGMNWLVNNVGIDGLYLDDVAFDRVTMKRIKRMLTQNGRPGIIDLHSANQYNKNDGFNNSANLYMEHFPYLNRLWFGEYFDYEKNNPDFFLTEVSGIPFGLMGEMLQDGGNAWRGMIYGMTSRMPWSENANPGPIWKLWDDFGMVGTEMIGYWSENCPIKTNNEKVLATVYKKKGAALISIASWAETNVNIQLQTDWKSLGLDPGKVTINAPAINHFQEKHEFKPGEDILVEKGKGWLLVVKEK